VQLAPPNEVQVQVKNFLAAVSIAIDDQPVAILRNAFVGRNFLCCQHHSTNELGLIRLYIVHRRNLCPWHNQDVHRGLRIDIAKCNDLVVFVDHIGRQLMPDYFAEYRFCHR
jgi:hypothetical protein